MKEEYIKKETTSFKELVKNEQIFAPCVWDCRTARAAELTGFKALMLSGGQLAGYVHKGFWQCMDTLREKQKLEKLWENGNAPWKLWKD